MQRRERNGTLAYAAAAALTHWRRATRLTTESAMTGEIAPARPRRSTQPGGRQPAPGELALVQAFINSHYDLDIEHGAELLADPAALGHWLTRHGLLDGGPTLGRRDLARALTVRERLRDLAGRNGAGPGVDEPRAELNLAAHGARVEIRFSSAGPSFVAPADTGLDGAIGLLLAITARALIDGSWHRLKICPGTDCGWAFYDHSRNLTGRWCSMAVCGGRAKARAHYRRRKAGKR
jgi:hypothetical protein